MTAGTPFVRQVKVSGGVPPISTVMTMGSPAAMEAVGPCRSPKSLGFRPPTAAPYWVYNSPSPKARSNIATSSMVPAKPAAPAVLGSHPKRVAPSNAWLAWLATRGLVTPAQLGELVESQR